jgi:RNA polymerase sigma factor (sigma-70 family)
MPTRINEVVRQLRQAVVQPDETGLTDGQLLACFIEHRDQAAVAALVQRHGPMVWGVCRRVLGKHHDAEDAFQATFLVLVRKAGSVRQREMVGNWLYGVAHQTALKARATTAKRGTRERQMTAMPDAQAPEQDPWRDLQPILDRELSRLPDKYRVAIVLCDLEAKTRKEAARQLGLPEGTLAGRLTRGRALLARRLARNGVVLSSGSLAAVLSEQASASVPASVLASTIKAVNVVTAGQAAATGVVSSAVAALADRVVKTMLLTKIMKVAVLLLLVLATGLLGAGLLSYGAAEVNPHEVRDGQRQETQAEKKPLSLQDLRQRFDALSPASRLLLVDKFAKEDNQFQPASRGDVTLAVVARGSLESATSVDIYCKVPAAKGSATTIKSIVDDGARVHKGEALVVLDDSGFQDVLKAKMKDYQRALANKQAAEAALDLQKLQNQVDELAREIELRVAELDVKQNAWKNTEEKEILKLRAEKARLSVPLTKAAGKLRLMQAEADLTAKTAVADAKLAVADGIKDQIAQCTIKAPLDGVVVYHVSEHAKSSGASQQPIIAQGEPVREGQKLLQITDLNNMLVGVGIPEASLSCLHGESKDKSKWQAALIKVDAYPNTVLKGHVKFVDNARIVAMYQEPLTKIIKTFYKALVAIDNDKNPNMPRLLPGMSAEVTIEEAARKTGVVRVPVQAVVHTGQGDYCYIKAGKEILKREVTLGMRNDQFAEIKAGLQEGETILRDVDAVLRQSSKVESVKGS